MNKKSYYAIIPATVRYCKKLAIGARLLYGEITALTNEKGYCWASNKYFADLYEVDGRTIRRWINSLIANRFIRVEIKGLERKIFIMDDLKRVPLDASGNEIEPKKSGFAKSPGKNVIAINLQKKFSSMCLKILGSRPMLDKAGYIRVLAAMNEGKLSEAQVLDLFDEWFKLGKSDDETISLTRALSNRQIEGYKVRNNVR